MLRYNFIILLLSLFVTANAQMNKKLRLENITNTDPAYAASILYSDGVKEYLLGNTQNAVELYKKVLSLNNEHSGALYQLGRVLRDVDPKGSLDYARRAYLTDTSNIEMVKLYVGSLLFNSKLQEAQDFLTLVRTRAGGKKQESYLFSIIVASQLRNDSTVISLSDEYIKYWGYNEGVVKAMSDAMINKKQYVQLDKKLDELALASPGELQLRVSMGRVKATLMDDKAAKENFRAAINIDSTAYEGYLAFADYYRVKNDLYNYLDNIEYVFRSKNLDAEVKAKFFEETFFDNQLLRDYYQKIRGIINTLFAAEPNNAEVERVMIRFVMYVGELKTAQNLLRGQIDRGIAAESSYKNLIDIELYQKNYDSVYMLAAQATKVFPKSVDFPLSVAIGKWQQEKPDAALVELKKCMKLAKSDSILSVIYSVEGDILYKMGKSRQAFAAYDKALSYDGDNAMMLNNYAYYLSQDKVRLEEALAMSIKSNKLSDNNSTYLDTQAWILYELGRYEEARTVQRMAVALSREESPELMLHYGDILYKLGDKTLAAIYWKRAADVGADKDEVAKRLSELK